MDTTSVSVIQISTKTFPKTFDCLSGKQRTVFTSQNYYKTHQPCAVKQDGFLFDSWNFTLGVVETFPHVWDILQL